MVVVPVRVAPVRGTGVGTRAPSSTLQCNTKCCLLTLQPRSQESEQCMSLGNTKIAEIEVVHTTSKMFAVGIRKEEVRKTSHGAKVGKWVYPAGHASFNAIRLLPDCGVDVTLRKFVEKAYQVRLEK